MSDEKFEKLKSNLRQAFDYSNQGLNALAGDIYLELARYFRSPFGRLLASGEYEQAGYIEISILAEAEGFAAGDHPSFISSQTLENDPLWLMYNAIDSESEGDFSRANTDYERAKELLRNS